MRRGALIGIAAVIALAALVWMALQSVAVDTWLFRQVVRHAVSGGTRTRGRQ